MSTRTSYLHSLRDRRTRPSPQPPPTGSGARPGRQQWPLKGWQRCRPLRTPRRPRRTGWTGSKSTRAGPAPTGQGMMSLTAHWGTARFLLYTNFLFLYYYCHVRFLFINLNQYPHLTTWRFRLVVVRVRVGAGQGRGVAMERRHKAGLCGDRGVLCFDGGGWWSHKLTHVLQLHSPVIHK